MSATPPEVRDAAGLVEALAAGDLREAAEVLGRCDTAATCAVLAGWLAHSVAAMREADPVRADAVLAAWRRWPLRSPWASAKLRKSA